MENENERLGSGKWAVKEMGRRMGDGGEDITSPKAHSCITVREGDRTGGMETPRGERKPRNRAESDRERGRGEWCSALVNCGQDRDDAVEH